MSETRPLYGSEISFLNTFPEPVRAALHLVQKPPASDASLVLLQCVASAAHPDYLFSLSMLSALPAEYKAAALEVIEHSLNCGLSLDEQTALLRFVEPYLARSLGAPRLR